MTIRLVRRRPRAVPAAVLAGVLLLLSVCADDGGADYTVAVERWEQAGLQYYRFT